MAWKSLFALFGKGRRDRTMVAVGLTHPRDTWRGVSDLVDIPESLASLLQTLGRDRSKRIDAMTARLSSLTNQERVELDLLARRWYHSGEERPLWWNLTPKDLEQIGALSTKGNPHLLGLTSFHPSGRVREAALRKLGELQHPEALPYLLLRLNDWADPVVQLAQGLLPHVAAIQSGTSVLEHLDLVLKLQRSTRRNHAPWVDHFLDYLSQPEQGDALFQGLRSHSLPTRRLCFDLALKTGAIPGYALLEISQSEPDPIIRRKVQQAVLSQAQPEDRERILYLALKDPVPSCRKSALEWLEKTKAPERESHCREALLDRSRSVRETARWTLRQLGVNNLREPYLAALNSDKQTRQVVGIHGLGEIGRKEDTTLVVPFVRSPIPSLRNAAITALGRLDAKGHTTLFLEAIASEHVGTSRLATEIILKNGPWPNRDWLLDLYQTTPHKHVRRRVLSLVHKLPKWQGMAFFLEVMPADPKGVDPTVAFYRERWLHSLLRVPPPCGAEREAAITDLRAARERLGWRVLPEVDGQLGI